MELNERTAAKSPIEQFDTWFKEAVAHGGIILPEATCLSTIGENDYPEGRMVLMKSFDERGFVFYTNWKSPKGRALSRHPRAALTFHWSALGRQVRITGDTAFLDPEDSDKYFWSRPRDSQVGAWASEQSAPIASREALEADFAEWARRFEGKDVIPRPEHWPGVRVMPKWIEFWQEQPNRLHDRLLYALDDGAWRITRLAP